MKIIKPHTGFAAIFFIMLLSACGGNYTPKPKAYHRIDFPEKSYTSFESDDCPFSFQYPKYAEILRDTLSYSSKVEHPCWLDLQFTQLNGTLHLSYKEIKDREDMMKLLEDAHKMTFNHSKKADFIDETSVKNDYGVEGVLFDVGGDAASSVQFYLTDDDRHFVRGALYFKSSPNIDSMGIVIDFVKADLVRFIETFQWS